MENYQPSKFDQLVFPSDADPSTGTASFSPYQEAMRFGVAWNRGTNLKRAVGEQAGEFLKLSRGRGRDSAFSEQDEKTSLATTANNMGVSPEKLSATFSDLASDGFNLLVRGASAITSASGTLVDNAQRTRATQVSDAARNRTDLGSIFLNMPNQVVLSEEASWAGQELGAVGQLARTSLGASGITTNEAFGASVVGNAGNLLATGVGAAAAKLTGVVGGFVGAVGAGIAGGKIQSAADSAFRVSQNPFLEMMFSGIGFRQFKFDFILRPRDSDEIETCFKIIKLFRMHSRPSWEGTFGRAFMNYPMEFDIDFLTRTTAQHPADKTRPDHGSDSWTKNVHLPSLKPCVCTNVETNYTPQSVWSAYERGAPIALTLGLSFLETELVTAQDVDNEPGFQASNSKGTLATNESAFRTGIGITGSGQGGQSESNNTF